LVRSTRGLAKGCDFGKFSKDSKRLGEGSVLGNLLFSSPGRKLWNVKLPTEKKAKTPELPER